MDRRGKGAPVLDSEERTLGARLLARVALTTAALTTLFLGALAVVEPTALEFTPLTAWLHLGFWITLAVAIQGQVGWTLRHALRRTSAALAEREAAHRDLADAFARLQESERPFERLFNAVPSGLILTRVADGVIVKANEAFERVMGWSREEALGRSTLALGIWPDEAARDRFDAAVHAGGGQAVMFDIPLRVRDGRERVMRLSTMVIEVQGEPMFFSEFSDVTSRRETEAALRLSERRFAAIFQEVPVALAVSEVATGHLLEVNPAFLRLMAAPSPSMLLGRNLVELGVLSPDFRQRVVAFVMSGQGGSLIGPGRRLNGEEYIGEASYAPYELDGKQLMLSCTLDITTRVRAEEELLRAERQYRELVDGVEDVVFSLAPDGTIATLSAAFERITGLAPEPWIGRAFHELLHPDDAARALEEVAQTLRAGPAENPPLRIRAADGRHRLAEIRLAPRFEDGLLTSIFGIGRDVTNRIVLEGARHDAEREREMTLTELAERVKELRVLHQTARLLQTAPQRLEDLIAEWIRLVPVAFRHPECCEARISFGSIVAATPGWRDTPWRLAAPITVAEERGMLEVVYLEERPDAAEGPFLAEERALIDSLVEMLVQYLEVRRYREGLEELVERRTRELRAARDEADQANRAKSTFLATMSHEIRTPMNAVLGNTQLLRRDHSLTPKQRTKVDVILSSGNHLLALLNNVLDMSKVEAGHATITVQAIDLRALLRDVENMFAATAGAKGLSLAFESRGELPRAVSTDAGKVRQVLVNLIGNALKFTVRGGVVIRTASERTGGAGLRITIEVQDSGPGIAAAELPRVFGVFEQTSLGAQVGGSGLGLAISREFAKLLGGELTAASTVGVGSTFRFTFSAQEESVDAARAAAEPLSPARLAPDAPPRRLLVVDDVAEGREVVAELLASVGFDVRAVASGEEALMVHDAWRPDLVLMDLRMPGIGGIEAIRRLREAGSAAVLVAFTASSIDMADEEVYRVGADDLILKPSSDADLLHAIGRHLHVRYLYEEPRPHASSPAAGVSATELLAALLSVVPPALREALEVAALSARTGRIEELAREIAPVAPDAADAVRDLARTFQYDRILAALSAARSPDD